MGTVTSDTPSLPERSPQLMTTTTPQTPTRPDASAPAAVDLPAFPAVAFTACAGACAAAVAVALTWAGMVAGVPPVTATFVGAVVGGVALLGVLAAYVLPSRI